MKHLLKALLIANQLVRDTLGKDRDDFDVFQRARALDHVSHIVDTLANVKGGLVLIEMVLLYFENIEDVVDKE